LIGIDDEGANIEDYYDYVSFIPASNSKADAIFQANAKASFSHSTNRLLRLIYLQLNISLLKNATHTGTFSFTVLDNRNTGTRRAGRLGVQLE